MTQRKSSTQKNSHWWFWHIHTHTQATFIRALNRTIVWGWSELIEELKRISKMKMKKLCHIIRQSWIILPTRHSGQIIRNKKFGNPYLSTSNEQSKLYSKIIFSEENFETKAIKMVSNHRRKRTIFWKFGINKYQLNLKCLSPVEKEYFLCTHAVQVGWRYPKYFR